MKLNKHLLAVAAVVAAMGLGSLATAQEKKDDKPVAPPGIAAPANRPLPDPTARLARMLNLNDEQKTKIKPIMDQELADLKAWREDKSLTGPARMAKYREIREAATEKVKPILNDEQKQKWEKMRNPRPPGTPGANPPAAPGAAPAAPKAPPGK